MQLNIKMSPVHGKLELCFVSLWIWIAIFKGYASGNESPFFILNSTMTWQEAKLSCETLNGRLVTIDTLAKYNFVLEMDIKYHGNVTLTDKVSIGLSTTSTDCTNYIWVSGSPMAWSKWANGEPNRCSERQCVKVRNGVFFTANCITATRAAMCEYVSELSSSPLPTTAGGGWTALTISTDLTETSVSSSVILATPSTLDIGTLMPTTVADSTVSSLVSSAEPIMITTVAMETTTPVITADITNTRIASSAESTTMSTVTMEPMTPTISTDTIETPIATADSINVTIATNSNMATTLATKTRMNMSCNCCANKNITQLSPTELLDAISQIRKELYVNKIATTMFRRTKISANDDRPTSKVMGGVACIILVAVIGSIIISDITMMFVFLCK